uniref:DUF3857 domain-containing protein n=1 Tax=uncultured Polaribacter sp. TaxID=174711 RepID=UPI00263680C7|nr:DUF3857 domain-containing protein [uncultured Polaribacter sp.]
MKKILLLLILTSITLNLFSQKKISTTIGKTSIDELKMSIYEKDSTASAVVLFEHANMYLDANFNYKTRTDYYFRIKILDKSAFDYSTISINLYDKKQFLDLKAITYNLTENGLIEKTKLSEDKVYKVEKSNKWRTVKFTMPNIKIGSVIEYSYSIISPYLSINDWYFQSDIPKIKSSFNASILGNYKYNIRKVGVLELDENDVSLDKNCIYIDGLGEGQCVKYKFSMKDIPAFEEEDFMLSKKNYISRLIFDLKTYTSPRGTIEKYTTTWREADKKLKSIFFNNQTSKKSFFRKRIPVEILKEENNIKKAKAIYKFIQNHYTWNNRYWSSEDEKVKDAFNTKTGSAGEINLSLFNSLNAADLDVNLVILSTRNNGIPTDLYPVIFDFNYVIVKLKINENIFFLDATSKYLPFGEIPFRCLNGRAREVNFKEDSNWISLKPKNKSSENTRLKLVIDENGDFNGTLNVSRFGYNAYKQREKIQNTTKKNYIEDFENKYPNTEVDSLVITNEFDNEKILVENFKIFVNNEDGLKEKIRLNPFLYNRYVKNPFKLKNRDYPVNFGYSQKDNFFVNIKIPNNYKVTQLPKNTIFSLPNNAARFIVNSKVSNNYINIYFRINLKKTIFNPSEYNSIKEFYNRIIEYQKSSIILEKI